MTAPDLLPFDAAKATSVETPSGRRRTWAQDGGETKKLSACGGGGGGGVVNSKDIMRLLYEFQMRNQNQMQSVPQERQATLEALVDAVNAKRVQEHVRKRKEEERAFACDAKVTLESVQDDMLKEEEEVQRIAEYFKSTFEEVSRQSPTDSEWKKKQLQNQRLMRQISQSARIATTNPAVREDMKNRIRELAKQQVTEHHRTAAARRLRHFKEKHPELADAKRPRKAVPPIKVEVARPSAQAGAVKREKARKQALAKIRRKSQASEAAGSAAVQVHAKKPKSVSASSKRSVMGKVSEADGEEELTYADKFYRTQRCLFNSLQMEAAERVFRHIVRDKDEAGSASAADDLLGAESSGTHALDETHALKASQLALQQKGVLARKVMTLSMFQQALSRAFSLNQGEGAMVKRIHAVMCGREAAERREGLTFAKFATYLSTFMLGTTQQKLFLCFEVLDTDRDGFISQHDIFMLLRCNADAALTSDFGVLMKWIVGAHERRMQREDAFAQTQRKRRALMRQALRDFAARHRRERRRARGEDGANEAGLGNLDEAEENDDDYYSDLNDDLDDNLDDDDLDDDDDHDAFSLGSFDSAGDWLTDDALADDAVYRELQEQNAQESRMDFDDFKTLWTAKSALPELVRLIMECFPQITAVRKDGLARRGYPGGRYGRLAAGRPVSGDRDGRREENGPEDHDKPRNFMANAMSLQKAKKGLLNTLRNRIKVTMLASRNFQEAQLMHAERKGAATTAEEKPSLTPAPESTVRPTPPPFRRQEQQQQQQQQQQDEARPGKFLRELGVSVALARTARISFERLRPDRLKGSVLKDAFVRGLMVANVGFESLSGGQALCGRLFSVCNTSGTGELSFSEFLVALTTALQGTRRDRARLTFDALVTPGRDHLEAHELEDLNEAGLSAVDPVLADYLLDVVVTRVTRGDKGYVYFKDLLVFGEEVRQRKEELAATALGGSRVVPAASRASLGSGGGGGGDEDRESVGSTAVLALGGARRMDRKLRSLSSCSTSSMTQRPHRRGRRRWPAVDLHVDNRPIEQRLADFELHSCKEEQMALRQHPDIDYVFIYKLVEAFLPTVAR